LNQQQKINIIDANSFRITDTLDFNATSLAFSSDSKYAFASGKSEIAIINIEDKKIINVFRLLLFLMALQYQMTELLYGYRKRIEHL
jgi:hypothetical protein